MRRTPAGEFVEADPNSLKTGDTVRLELMANERGVLSVLSGGKNLFTRQVERLATYTTEPLKESDRELSVQFTRQPLVTLTGNAVLDQKKNEAAAVNIQPVAAERATYVTGQPTAQTVHFTISLNYK